MLTFGSAHRQFPLSRRAVIPVAVACFVASSVAVVATPAGAMTGLKAAVSLSPASSSLGRTVTATIGKSTKPAGDSLKKIALNWGDGSKAVRLSGLSSRAGHRYSHPGAFTVRLTLTDVHGNVARGSAIEHVLTQSGSYTGHSTSPYPLSFYVSSSRRTVQDVSGLVPLNCTDSSSLYDELVVPASAIGASGSFASTVKDTGVLRGRVASYTHHFTGHFIWSTSASAVQATGTMRETITFPDSGVTCTTNTLSWSGQRDSQPAQQDTAPLTGSYTGHSQSPYLLSFYVSFSRKTVQDVAALEPLGCTDGTSLYDELIVPSAPIHADNSFGATATDTGILGGKTANYTYRFRGNFHSIGSNSAQRAAGTMRETITFPDSGVTCSTDTQPWSGQRDSQPAQQNAAPLTGSYTGHSPSPYSLFFYVSFSRTTVQDISALEPLGCTDGTSLYDELVVPDVAINADNSFATTATDTGILGGKTANYTYRFRGNFHSTGSNAALRAAGTMRETITFPDSGVTCSTDTQPWSGQRDSQPTQLGTSPPTGAYTGHSPSPYALTFTVASGTSIQNVSEQQPLTCSDNTFFYDSLVIPTVTINSDNSFAGTAEDTGVLNTHPVSRSLAFRGNFHGLGSDAVERAAGTIRETLTYTDTGVTCTSNTQPWTGGHS